MKTLIVARHGDYNQEGNELHLSEKGARQMEELGEKLRPYANGGKVLILTSTADRAAESAKVLAKVLDASIEGRKELWSDAQHPQDNDAALMLVLEAAKDADMLVLVTHLEYVESIPYYFGKEVLKADFRGREIPKGTAWIIDCEKKTIERSHPL